MKLAYLFFVVYIDAAAKACSASFQSPHFRLQEKLSAKNMELRRLQQQVIALEGDKQEMSLSVETETRKNKKLGEWCSILLT